MIVMMLTLRRRVLRPGVTDAITPPPSADFLVTRSGRIIYRCPVNVEEEFLVNYSAVLIIPVLQLLGMAHRMIGRAGLGRSCDETRPMFVGRNLAALLWGEGKKSSLVMSGR